MKTPHIFKGKSGKRFIVTKSPKSVFTKASEDEITRKCLECLKVIPAKAKQQYCKPLPTLNRLEELFVFDVLKGTIHHKKSRGGMNAGDLAGCYTYGYVQTYVDYTPYRNHRLIFKYHYKRNPVGILDHIDGNRSNNSIMNLREVTALQNAQNRHACNSNTGIIGVSYCSTSRRYLADIGYNNQTVHLGRYINLDCAIKARKHAESILFSLPQIMEVA